MRTSRGAWSLAGLVAGLAGLATSYFVAMAMTIRESPVVAVAELVIRLTPGPVAERAIRILGHLDKPLLILGILLILARPLRVRRPAGPAVVVAAGRRVRRARAPWARSRWRSSPAPPSSDYLPARGRLRDLAGLPVAADRAAAPGRAGRVGRGVRGAGEPVGGRAPRPTRPQPPRVPDPRRRADGGVGLRRGRRAGRRHRPPARRGDPAAAAALGGHRPAGPARRPGRAARASARGRRRTTTST